MSVDREMCEVSDGLDAWGISWAVVVLVCHCNITRRSIKSSMLRIVFPFWAFKVKAFLAFFGVHISRDKIDTYHKSNSCNKIFRN